MPGLAQAIIAALVTALGGTPEEADAVWLRVNKREMPTMPSWHISMVLEALEQIRTGA